MSDASISCTLLPDDLKLRLTELAALSRSALVSAKRDDLTLHLQYAPEAVERVRRMAERERECCAFLTFEFEIRPDVVILRITAPEAAREAVQDIYTQFVNS
jgi:hypothetical protein